MCEHAYARDEATLGRDRRRAGRVRQGYLRCNLGQIVDLSASGMRIRRAWGKRVGRTAALNIQRHRLGGPLIGRVMWCRRVGLFTHEIGVHFIDPHPHVIHRLAEIAGCAGLRLLRPPQHDVTSLAA